MARILYHCDLDSMLLDLKAAAKFNKKSKEKTARDTKRLIEQAAPPGVLTYGSLLGGAMQRQIVERHDAGSHTVYSAPHSCLNLTTLSVVLSEPSTKRARRRCDDSEGAEVPDRDQCEDVDHQHGDVLFQIVLSNPSANKNVFSCQRGQEDEFASARLPSPSIRACISTTTLWWCGK